MKKTDAYWLNLGLMSYNEAFKIQEEILSARMLACLPATVIVQQSPRTFTIGRSGSRNNILLPAEDLEREGFEVIEVNRGGDVTYHGPGQLILSPLLFLGDLNLNANQYMHALEQVLLKTLSVFGIPAINLHDFPGVWVGPAKIGAVGIGVRHGFTFHGMSLNINLDLIPFKYINPCGVVAMPVTSMQAELGRQVQIEQVEKVLLKTLEDEFLIVFQSRSLGDIRQEINFKALKEKQHEL
ncbi:MAG: lipoyl(octanoyl) transferase LipB [Anaerolineae bacterium]|nr:lipoyl(octanoyl) transferase LipB [Anaerolineae bacterium]